MKQIKKKWKNYQDYLQSPEWKKFRKKTIERVKKETNCTEAYCELCGGDDKLQIHHWKYPQDWNDDNQDFHILLCEKCHSDAHIYIDNNDVFNSRDKFLIKLLKAKYFSVDEERIEFFNLFHTSVINRKLKLIREWNSNSKSFNGLLKLNGYTVFPPLDETVISIFKERDK